MPDGSPWGEPRLPPEQEAVYVAIIEGRQGPDQEHYQNGHADHAEGKQFHEGPRPMNSIEALSWRMGWNDAALGRRG